MARQGMGDAYTEVAVAKTNSAKTERYARRRQRGHGACTQADIWSLGLSSKDFSAFSMTRLFSCEAVLLLCLVARCSARVLAVLAAL